MIAFGNEYRVATDEHGLTQTFLQAGRLSVSQIRRKIKNIKVLEALFEGFGEVI